MNIPVLRLTLDGMRLGLVQALMSQHNEIERIVTAEIAATVSSIAGEPCSTIHHATRTRAAFKRRPFQPYG